MKWSEHGALMEGMKNAYKTLVGKPEWMKPFRSLDEDGKIILKWILGTAFIWLRIGTGGRLL
jgi:hypothetical protein